ncbi:V-set and immunoglobulin domain-containing protein 8-like [Lacerta agilis]|uniref:V-set and immunoglobulin domain-containing protein 8-like n=1 Tax=Lacerta agilis TaxID=80427 RepID=UPI0014191876|nr:V-set and immunoglobulin domain-containing protein 8-like [Lacerta agilis]
MTELLHWATGIKEWGQRLCLNRFPPLGALYKGFLCGVSLTTSCSQFRTLRLLYIPLFFCPPALLPAVKINAKGREVVYLAEGESIKLGCPYELEPQDHGPSDLDIEWTQMNSDPTNLDNVILSYNNHQVIHPGYHYLQTRGGSAAHDSRHFGNSGLQQNMVIGGSGHDCCSGLQQRVTFAIQDPSQYDASINLQDVQISDSATYECKVKKTTVATRKVTVMVLARPSNPQCSVVGKVAVGQKVTLSCSSNSGTSPLMYQWAKVTDRPFANWLSATTVKGPNPGDLIIPNLSNDHAGVYQCSVANKVGSARCVVEISFSKGKRVAFFILSKYQISCLSGRVRKASFMHRKPTKSSRVSIIVGVVLGSILFLTLLVCLIVGLICCCRKRRYKEEASQIRVDTAPPRARGGSRNSSIRSFLDFMPHNISFMQRRKYDPPREQEGTEMVSPAQEAQPVDCSGMKSEAPRGGCSTTVTTKARVHYAPSVPSSPQATSSPSAADPNNGGSCSTTSEKGRRGHPGQYGGIPVMVPAKSRDGLLV